MSFKMIARKQKLRQETLNATIIIQAPTGFIVLGSNKSTMATGFMIVFVARGPYKLLHNSSRAGHLTQCDCFGICYNLQKQQVFRKCIIFSLLTKWLRGRTFDSAWEQSFLNFFQPFGVTSASPNFKFKHKTIFLPLSCFSTICRCHARAPFANLPAPPV